MNSQYPTKVDLPYWVFPSIYTVVCLLLNYFAGSLDFPATNTLREQRDFNAALGMPVVTGYLWLTVRLLHQRAAKSLVNYLLSQHRLADFSIHRQRLESRLLKHVIFAATLSLSVTLIYLTTENLLALDLALHVLLLNLMAVPFWFFIWLFVFQIIFITRYVIRHFVGKTQFDLYELRKLKPISDLVLTNTVFAMAILAITPVFWYRVPVPFIDIIILTVLMVALVVYVFWPVLRMRQLVKKQKAVVVDNLNNQMQQLFENNSRDQQLDDDARLRKLEVLQNQKEDVYSLSEWPLDLPQVIKVIIVSTLLPLSWLVLAAFENMFA